MKAGGGKFIRRFPRDNRSKKASPLCPRPLGAFPLNYAEHLIHNGSRGTATLNSCLVPPFSFLLVFRPFILSAVGWPRINHRFRMLQWWNPSHTDREEEEEDVVRAI